MASSRTRQKSNDAKLFNFGNIDTAIRGEMKFNEAPLTRKRKANASNEIAGTSHAKLNSDIRQNDRAEKACLRQNSETVPKLITAKSFTEKTRTQTNIHSGDKLQSKGRGKDSTSVFESWFPITENPNIKENGQHTKNVRSTATNFNGDIRASQADMKGQALRFNKDPLKPFTKLSEKEQTRLSLNASYRNSSKPSNHFAGSNILKEGALTSLAQSAEKKFDDNSSKLNQFKDGSFSATWNRYNNQEFDFSNRANEVRSTSPDHLSTGVMLGSHVTPRREKEKLQRILNIQVNSPHYYRAQEDSYNQFNQLRRYSKKRSSSTCDISCRVLNVGPNKANRFQLLSVDNKVVEAGSLPLKSYNQFENNIINVRAPYQIRDRNYHFAIRLKSYLSYLQQVNFSNMVHVEPVQWTKSQQLYKCSIRKGNNHVLIKNALKQRWWWQTVETNDSKKDADINFLWSPWRNDDFLLTLKHHNYSNFETRGASRNGLQNEKCFSQDVPLQENASGARMFSKLDALNHKIGEDLIDIQAGQENTQKNMQHILNERAKHSRGCLRHQFKLIENASSNRICNHIEKNYLISNKKTLFLNLKLFYQSQNLDPFDFIPLTYHIRSGVTDSEYAKFRERYESNEKSSDGNIWIVKPGENTNRGVGITVCKTLNEIEEVLASEEYLSDGKSKTYILQKYIDNPLLYHKRKFDIRCFLLITSVNGIQKGYWYQDGYIRTSSLEFSLKDLTDKMVHLTNDAIQKNGDDYGKYEPGNKVPNSYLSNSACSKASYSELQRYLDARYTSSKVNYMEHIYPKLKKSALDAVLSVYGRLDPHRKECSFELFGLDFMIDDTMKPWLIEINTNPCLELSSPLLSKTIPSMIENMLRIAIDPIFPPPVEWPTSKRGWVPENPFDSNKFELIFDERETELPNLGLITANQYLGGIIDEDQEESETEFMK